MAYNGYRHILPQQDSDDWTHPITGEKGVYSNYQLTSSTQLLDGAPDSNRLTDPSPYSEFGTVMQEYLGLFEYNPMELDKYSPFGQDVPYMRHEIWEFHGLEGSRVFPEGYGEEFNASDSMDFYSNRGVPSQFELDGGHAQRVYGEGAANMGPIRPYEYRGVDGEIMEDPGTPLSTKQGSEDTYGFRRVGEWNGVSSAKAL